MLRLSTLNSERGALGLRDGPLYLPYPTEQHTRVRALLLNGTNAAGRAHARVHVGARGVRGVEQKQHSA